MNWWQTGERRALDGSQEAGNVDDGWCEMSCRGLKSGGRREKTGSGEWLWCIEWCLDEKLRLTGERRAVDGLWEEDWMRSGDAG